MEKLDLHQCKKMSLLSVNQPINQQKNVKCVNDYSVRNEESLRGHCTNERKVGRKRDKKVRRDVI